MVRAILVLLATLLAACGPNPDGDDGRLRVVATTTQVGSVASELGGEDIELTVLLEPGIEAHDFELSPADGAALEEADLILVSGAGLEDWLTDAIDTIGDPSAVRDLSDGVTLRVGDGHSEEGEDHDGEVTDPHYWLDPDNAVTLVENARDALADAAPDRADAFAERAAALAGRIEAADAEARALIEEVPADARALVTDHDALGYFADAYGLTIVGTIFPSLDVSSEPSAQEIETLVAEMRAAEVTAIFTESAVDPRLAEAVAVEAGARVIDDPLYTDSLGATGSGAETLDAVLVHNARVIRDGLIGD